MEALIASYGNESSDESDTEFPTQTSREEPSHDIPIPLPPPPLSVLNLPNSLDSVDCSVIGQPSRVRNFPHVEGNYPLHVYIPVYIPTGPKKDMAMFLKRVARAVPGLHMVDADIALDLLSKDDDKLELVALGREFHISLGRTVPIRVHQIDSVLTMLRQRLQLQRRYWIDFSKWEIFINDDRTRTFLSMEVTATGLSEITKQIQGVNEVYRLHNLPEFYKDPRPHISIVWAMGDISNTLKTGIQQESRFTAGERQKSLFSCKFSGIECRIGNKTYKICTNSDQ